jgi:hypothetical protein
VQLRATSLTSLLLFAACTRVDAQALPGTLHACRSITSNKERLACFDREVAKLEAATEPKDAAPASIQSKPGVQASAAGKPNTPLAPEQTFGLTGDQIVKLEARQEGAPRAQLKNLTAQVASVSHNSSGHWVVTLNNGQVWRQTETRSDFEVSPGASVKISPGAMGSFFLQTNPHNWTRVERVL